MELIGVPWASVLAASSVVANERNTEELESLASALRLCPCLRACSGAQRIECARVCTVQRFAAEQIVRLSVAKRMEEKLRLHLGEDEGAYSPLCRALTNRSAIFNPACRL